MGLGLLDSVFAGKTGFSNVLVSMFAGSGDLKATITYATNRSYDKKTRTETGTDTTSYSCDMTPPTAYNEYQLNDTSIKAGDMMTVISSYQTPEKPPVKAELLYASEKWTIVNVIPLTSGNEVVNYRLQLRRV